MQARFMEGKKWFPGNITKVNRDGTYDIAYNDGTDESRVPKVTHQSEYVAEEQETCEKS